MSNADAIAFAIVGAARAYGDDPLKALGPIVGAGRQAQATRCVPAAIAALATRTGDRGALCRVLGRNPQSIHAAVSGKKPAFVTAVEAARALVAFAAEAVAEDEAEDEQAFDDEAAVFGPGGWRSGAAAAAPAPAPEVAPDIESAPSEPDSELEPPAPPPRAPITAQDILAARTRVAPPAPAAHVHRPTGGPLSCTTRPTITPSADPPPKPGGMNAQILSALKDGAHNSQGLATRLGAKEAVVSQALSMLRHQGRIVSSPAQGNTRAHRWSLAEANTGAAA